MVFNNKKINFKRLIRFVPGNVIWLLLNFQQLKRFCSTQLNIENVKILNFCDWHVGFLYFTGRSRINQEKVFIKICYQSFNTCYTESLLKDYPSDKHFPEVYYYFESPFHMIITQFVDGVTLNNINAFNNSDYETFVHQALEILDYLNAHKIIHRDIRPENLLWTTDKRLILIDFGWAYFRNKYNKEIDTSILNMLNISYRSNTVEFDDAFSMYKIAEEKIENNAVFLSIKSRIGRLVFNDSRMKGLT